MKSPAEKYGIDMDYLRRCKEMTPGARLDWLAAAWEFNRGIEAARQAQKQPTKKRRTRHP